MPLKVTSVLGAKWNHYVVCFLSVLLVSNHMIFLVQFEINPLSLGAKLEFCLSNSPRLIYQCSNMAPRRSGQTSIFGVVFFVV